MRIGRMGMITLYWNMEEEENAGGFKTTKLTIPE